MSEPSNVQSGRTSFSYSYVKSTGFYSNIKDNRLNPIPANAIIYKSLTGIGATTAEILYPRNSIIVLPNLPVIKGKQQKHGDKDNTFAVHEDVKTEQLALYLLASNGKPKKILTTPEGFQSKVKLAMKQIGVNMYKDYFLLFDEAHKYILDNGYRESMITPFDYFFKFSNKALISATPLKVSDPRFEDQGFISININPVYDIKENLKLIHTNNVAYALRKYMKDNPQKYNCIFYNSIAGIMSVIKSLGIEDECQIFCSNFSKQELTINDFEDVFSEFTEDTQLAKYNFFTSSFYNGLDITLNDIKPNLIMVTSVRFAEHTAIDPYTDAIQIVGRIRNKTNSIVHITDTNDKINSKSPDQLIEEINTSAEVYQAINTLKLSASSPFAKQLYNEALERMNPYFDLLNKPEQRPITNQVKLSQQEELESEELTVNYFKLDNYLYRQRIINLYADIQSLAQAYQQTRAFNLSQDIMYQKVSKEDLLKRFGGRYTSPDVYKDITNILWDLEALELNDPLEYQRSLVVLRQRFSLIVDAYFKLGIDKLIMLGFNHRQIQHEVIKQDAENGLNQHPVIDAVYNLIPYQSRVKVSVVKLIMDSIYKEFNINKKAKATDIKHFYKVEEIKINSKRNKRIEQHRGYKMIEPLFNVHADYRRS